MKYHFCPLPALELLFILQGQPKWPYFWEAFPTLQSRKGNQNAERLGKLLDSPTSACSWHPQGTFFKNDIWDDQPSEAPWGHCQGLSFMAGTSMASLKLL